MKKRNGIFIQSIALKLWILTNKYAICIIHSCSVLVPQMEVARWPHVRRAQFDCSAIELIVHRVCVCVSAYGCYAIADWLQS